MSCKLLRAGSCDQTADSLPTEQARREQGWEPTSEVGRVVPFQMQGSPGSKSATGLLSHNQTHTPSRAQEVICPSPHPRPQTPNTPISDLISPLPLTHSVRNTGLFAIGSCTHCSLCLKCYSPDGSLPIQNSPSQRGLSCRMLTARGQGCVVNGEMLVRGYKRPLIR